MLKVSHVTPMSQHFLLGRTAKTLSLAQVFRMSDAEAEEPLAVVTTSAFRLGSV